MSTAVEQDGQKDAGPGRTPRRTTGSIRIIHMLRALVFLIGLALLGGVALLGYSYSGFLQPDREEVTQPVDLNGG